MLHRTVGLPHINVFLTTLEAIQVHRLSGTTPKGPRFEPYFVFKATRSWHQQPFSAPGRHLPPLAQTQNPPKMYRRNRSTERPLIVRIRVPHAGCVDRAECLWIRFVVALFFYFSHWRSLVLYFSGSPYSIPLTSSFPYALQSSRSGLISRLTSLLLGNLRKKNGYFHSSRNLTNHSISRFSYRSPTI